MQIVTSPKNHFSTLFDSTVYTFWFSPNIIEPCWVEVAMETSNVKIPFSCNNQKFIYTNYLISAIFVIILPTH